MTRQDKITNAMYYTFYSITVETENEGYLLLAGGMIRHNKGCCWEYKIIN